ncbi:hypothetical protein RHECIAT_CH0001206 [Rhizobium etli CIAT 652]|uniref:LysR substrate-binding domain-containing protein n=1 Tax=Rhizobium etli (strain CIAT 652) TaxID=491916 RepID=B3PT21_RHIE6|nr:hypothetical protein RHECIAT_CH0001206 [Rhizobium etli CIAT 652]
MYRHSKPTGRQSWTSWPAWRCSSGSSITAVSRRPRRSRKCPQIAEGLDEPTDLARCRFIHWETSALGWATATRTWVDWTLWLEQIGASGVESSSGLRFSDYNLAVQAAIAGQGVVLGSRPVLADLVSAGLLVRAVPQSVRTDVGYDAVTTRNAIKRGEVESFIGWIATEAKGHLTTAYGVPGAGSPG